MVSSLNDEIDFRNSFDDSDDEDYTVVSDKNSFSYKIISSNDLKTDSENDNEKVNMPLFPSPEPTRPRCIFFILLKLVSKNGYGVLDMEPLPPHDQRHLWLRYQVVGYTKEIVHDFEQKLKTIFSRQVNRVYILYFEGLTPDMRQDLAERMRMFRSLYSSSSACRIGNEMGLDVAGLHSAEEMTEDGFRAYWLGSERVIPDKGDPSDY
ncbi:hypothetical protein Tco_1156976 [Tanacetum coccineum]